MDKNEIMRRMRGGSFKENNTVIMRTIILMADVYRYAKLSNIKYAFGDITDADFLASVNFLAEAGYINVRDIASKQSAEVSDFAMSEVEVKLSVTGNRLFYGSISDDAIGTI